MRLLALLCKVLLIEGIYFKYQILGPGQDFSYNHFSGSEAKNRLKMGVLECL
jgi:hypothetical protein